MCSLLLLLVAVFAAAYALAASPARWALERHDWNGAAALEPLPQWFQPVRASAASPDRAAPIARAYASQLLEIAKHAEGSRPEIEWSRAYMQQVK